MRTHKRIQETLFFQRPFFLSSTFLPSKVLDMYVLQSFDPAFTPFYVYDFLPPFFFGLSILPVTIVIF